MVFSFPRERRLSVIGVCRRLVVFSFLFFRCHCKHASGVLRGFFSQEPWSVDLLRRFLTKLRFVVSLRKTLVSARESGRLDGVLLRSAGFASGGRSSAEALGIGLGDAGTEVWSDG